ncbi:hypothetical protein C8R44DRAFT_779143 [Mycena epipterygia]|nr:hypothetical protein C8R44DRAFT_779143 [Mycena epipterygia]
MFAGMLQIYGVQDKCTQLAVLALEACGESGQSTNSLDDMMGLFTRALALSPHLGCSDGPFIRGSNTSNQVKRAGNRTPCQERCRARFLRTD